MFKAISWGQYVGAVLVLLLLYYAYVAAVYYRAELLGLVKGKGNAAGGAPAPAQSLGSLMGKGPLIAKSAITLPASPPEVAGPAKAPAATEQPAEPTDRDEEASGQEHEQEPAEESRPVGELPPLDLPTAEVSENIHDGNAIKELSYDAKAINFTEQEDITSALPSETASQEYDPSFTIGIAQLGDFLERAAEGQITQQEIVEQEPALENTDVLLAFFQASTERVQRATSHIYAGVAEVALH